MTEVIVRNLNLKLKHSFFNKFYEYKDTTMDNFDIAIEYYKELGYNVFGDKYLFINTIICFFWEDITDKSKTDNLIEYLDNIKEGDPDLMFELDDLKEDIIKKRIENAKINNFREDLYSDLYNYYISNVSEKSTFISDYLESKGSSHYLDGIIKCMKNLPDEAYYDYLDKYESNLDSDTIESFKKAIELNIRLLNSFNKATNEEYETIEEFENELKEMENIEINDEDIEFEDLDHFISFISNEYYQECLYTLIDDDFYIFLEDKFNLIKGIFDSFNDEKLFKIFKRLVKFENIDTFPEIFAFKEDKLKLIYYHDDEIKPLNEYNNGWILYLKELGFDIEILTINYTIKQQKKLLKEYEEEKYTLKINKEKFKINNANDLIDYWSEIKKLAKKYDVYINTKKIGFKNLEKVYECILKRNESNLNYEYCFYDEDDFILESKCKYLSEKIPEIELDRYYFDSENKFCYLKNDKEVIFNNKAISNKYKEITTHLKLCPYFNKRRVKKFTNTQPKVVRLETNTNWNLFDEEGDSWYYFREKWFNEEGDFNFPGFKNMAGIEKTNNSLRTEAKIKAFPHSKSEILNNNNLINIEEIGFDFSDLLD